MTTDAELMAQEIWFKVSAGMMGLLATAFLAWAGVIWSAWQDLSDRLFAMSESVARVEVKMEGIVDQVHVAMDFIQRHEGRPWHDKAGNAHAATSGQLDVIRERLDHLEQKR